MIKQVFFAVLSASLSASFVIGGMLLLTHLLDKKYTAKWKCHAWLLILAYLILPVNFLLAPRQTPFIISIPDITIEEIESHDSENPTLAPVQAQPNDQEIEAQSDTFYPVKTTSIVYILILLWLLGIFCYLIYQASTYLLFRKRLLRWSKAPNDAVISSVISEIAADMKIRRPICVQISPYAHSPLLIGYCNTILILPTEPYRKEDLSLVVRHELTHYQRKDLWYKLLLALVKAVHWFNPFIWVMSRRINIDLERACDDKVLEGHSVAYRTAYSEMLLSAVSRQYERYCGFTTNFKGAGKALDERFQNIFNVQKRKSGVAILITVFVALLTVGFLTSCSNVSNSRGQQEAQSAQNWKSAELSLSENGEPRIRYSEQDEWETLGEPIAAPKEWSSDTEIESRQEATALSYSPQTYMAMVSVDDGWLVATYGNGVANADTYIYRTHDGGTSWNETKQLEQAMWYPNHVLFIDDQNAVITIGSFADAPIFQTSDGGMTWELVKLPLEDGMWEAQELTAIQDGILLTVTDRGQNPATMKTLFSKDNGKTWLLE